MLEVSFGGVFVPAVLLWAGVGFVLSSVFTRVLSRTNFYEVIWHRALFDFTLWLVIWALISAVPYLIAFSGIGWGKR